MHWKLFKFHCKIVLFVMLIFPVGRKARVQRKRWMYVITNVNMLVSKLHSFDCSVDFKRYFSDESVILFFIICKSETNNSSDESLGLSISDFNPNSRLVREFEILNFIGKGAFGDVLKVHYFSYWSYIQNSLLVLIPKFCSINRSAINWMTVFMR